MTTIALGIPHLPDGGERDQSLADLLAALKQPSGPVPALAGREYLSVTCKIFDEKKPNRAWAHDMWQWGIATGADLFLTLQDDTEVMPRFWDALAAMLPALPPRAVLGLAGHHPGCETAYRQDARWGRTRAWVVGWAYAMHRADLVELVAYERSTDPKLTEDSLINVWCSETGRDAWHPLPSPVDHRLDLPSTYPGNTGHTYRKSHVRWDREPELLARMVSPDYWKIGRMPLGLVEPHPPGVLHTVLGSPNYGGSPPAPR